MTWDNYSVESKAILIVFIFGFVFIISSLFSGSNLIFFVACFFLVVVIANQFYLKKAGYGLNFDNNNERNHFFINEKGNWALTFHNYGLPILKGELRVFFNDYVAPLDHQMEAYLSQYELKIPISLFTNQTKKIKIPFQANKRGVAKIIKMEIRIPSLIGFGEAVLKYNLPISQEAIVYPSRIPVKGLMDQVSNTQGIHSVPFSVYEERLGPMGTRDYVSSDSFNRIHWKASARKQTLQTKIYERVSERSWILSINIADGFALNLQLEELLSSVAEFAYYAQKRNIPYSLCMNVRMAGSTPFLHLTSGEGKEHLQKVLETLSSINHLHVYPYDRMLSIISNHMAQPAFFLHAGLRSSKIDSILYQIGKNGTKLLCLNAEEDFGYISSLDLHKERRVAL